MAKKKNMEALRTLGGIFCLFVVFLNCLSLLGSLPIRLSSLLLPSLWLLLGVCLMTTRKNWLIVVGLLPLTILMVQQAAFPLPLDDLTALVHALLGRLLPGIGYGVLLLLVLLPAAHTAVGLRRSIWWMPMLLVLPSCILQHTSALVWAQFGMIACVSLWFKPAGR